jgi:ferredoxin
MTLTPEIKDALQAHGLALRGISPDGQDTVLLIGPDEPAFWPIFSTSSEYLDGLDDPLDRWSKRILNQIAKQFGGRAVFPSDGPPYPPFLSWAQTSGQCWQSPIGPLVHDQAGLFISYRGALVLPGASEIPAIGESPCTDCAQPCTQTCPVEALSVDHFYDIPRCKDYLASEAGQDCMAGGCLARRSCPVAVDFQRLPQQSAFHMRAFMKNYVA